MQSLVAKLGVHRITSIAVFNTREERTYNPFPDLEVRFFLLESHIGGVKEKQMGLNRITTL
ncbi:unnamed protein product [Prunus armeniaca]